MNGEKEREALGERKERKRHKRGENEIERVWERCSKYLAGMKREQRGQFDFKKEE